MTNTINFFPNEEENQIYIFFAEQLWIEKYEENKEMIKDFLDWAYKDEYKNKGEKSLFDKLKNNITKYDFINDILYNKLKENYWETVWFWYREDKDNKEIIIRYNKQDFLLLEWESNNENSNERYYKIQKLYINNKEIITKSHKLFWSLKLSKYNFLNFRDFLLDFKENNNFGQSIIGEEVFKCLLNIYIWLQGRMKK